MKKNITSAVLALIFSTLTIFAFVSCDKDTKCKLEVNVVRSDNNLPVSGAHITIGKQGATITDEGTSDANGMYTTTFDAPAIFDVVAEQKVYTMVYDTIYGKMGIIERIDVDSVYKGRYINTTSVRLKDGETVDCTVKLDYNNLQ